MKLFGTRFKISDAAYRFADQPLQAVPPHGQALDFFGDRNDERRTITASGSGLAGLQREPALQAVRRLRPFWRRLLMTLRPSAERMRLRKPAVLLRLIFEGFVNVFFISEPGL